MALGWPNAPLGHKRERNRQNTTEHNLEKRSPLSMETPSQERPDTNSNSEGTGQTQSKSLSPRIEKLHRCRQGFACKGGPIRTLKNGNPHITLVYNEFRAP